MRLVHARADTVAHRDSDTDLRTVGIAIVCAKLESDIRALWVSDDASNRRTERKSDGGTERGADGTANDRTKRASDRLTELEPHSLANPRSNRSAKLGPDVWAKHRPHVGAHRPAEPSAYC